MTNRTQDRSTENALDEPTEVSSGTSEYSPGRQEERSPLAEPEPDPAPRLHRRTLAFGALAAATAIATTWAGSALSPSPGPRIAALLGCALFVVLAGAAVRSLAHQVSRPLRARADLASAHLVRMVLTGVGYVFVTLLALVLLKVPVGQLLVSGAITVVVVGIAAQQSLGNAFAGIMLLTTAPFRVGDRITLRSGALGGQYDGTVTDVSLTFTTLQTIEGPMTFPNSAVLGAATGRRGSPASEF